MNAKTRRRIEMGRRVLDFSRAHPDTSPGYASTLARLEETLAQAAQLIDLQRSGIQAVRAATVQKRDLRRVMRRTQLMHLALVAERATEGVPDLAKKFELMREQTPYLEFRAAARAMLAEALNQKELLVQHGLAEPLLEGLISNLDLFDKAIEQGTQARRVHVGASAELDDLGDEIVYLAKVMNPVNRFRFGSNSQLLAEWETASNVIGPPRSSPEKGPGGGKVAPAA